MNLKDIKSNKNILTIIGIFILAILVIFIIIFFLGNNNGGYDGREKMCIGKTINSIEYDIAEKKCFETEISACQTPTFTSIDECKELNGIE